MSHPKRIVVEDYPVENLPEELRAGIEPGHRVTVTVEDGDPWSDLFRQIEEYRERNPHRVTTEEAVGRIRALRDEWD